MSVLFMVAETALDQPSSDKYHGPVYCHIHILYFKEYMVPANMFWMCYKYVPRTFPMSYENITSKNVQNI